MNLETSIGLLKTFYNNLDILSKPSKIVEYLPMIYESYFDYLYIFWSENEQETYNFEQTLIEEILEFKNQLEKIFKTMIITDEEGIIMSVLDKQQICIEADIVKLSKTSRSIKHKLKKYMEDIGIRNDV